MRRCEAMYDTESIADVVHMIFASDKARKVSIEFELQHFLRWNHYIRFLPLPRIQRQLIIQFCKRSGTVHTRSKTR